MLHLPRIAIFLHFSLFCEREQSELRGAEQDSPKSEKPNEESGYYSRRSARWSYFNILCHTRKTFIHLKKKK